MTVTSLPWMNCPLTFSQATYNVENWFYIDQIKEEPTKWSSLPSTVGNIFSLLMGIQIAAKSLKSCPTLCNPIDSSPPGSPIPGILQARPLEWVAISFSRGSSWPRVRPHVSRISCFVRQVLYHWAIRGSAPELWQRIYYKKYGLKYLSQSQEVCNGLVQTEEAGDICLLAVYWMFRFQDQLFVKRSRGENNKRKKIF